MKNNGQTRRDFIKVAGLGIAGLSLPMQLPADALYQEDAKSFLVYIGTYTDGASEGIYLYRLNVQTGALTAILTTPGVENPSYLDLDPDKRFLFAVNEIGEFEGQKTGTISAFSIDRGTGSLTFLNRQKTGGAHPCYVKVDKTGKSVMVANYSGGNVAIYPIQTNGHLGNPTEIINHKLQGVTKQAHAHCILNDPQNKFAFAADLGLDSVFIYQLDPENAKLKANQPHTVSTAPGAGPRHFVFHPSKQYAFLINELNSTMTSFSYDPKRGALREIQTVSTLPKDFSGKSFCADVRVSPDGRFLYGSNRGHNSIVVFEIGQQDGRLSLIEHVSTKGDWPRNFAIDPTGRILMVANQRSHDIFTFSIDSRNGRLTPTGHKLEVPSPVCLKVVQDFIG